MLHQKQLWEQNLELRILLQRCLQAANRMPHAASHAAVLSADKGLAQGYARLVATASDVIDEMLALHSALVEQHPAARQSAEASVAANGKRQRQEAEHGGEGVDSAKKWQRIDEEYRKLVPFRDASVDRWLKHTTTVDSTPVRWKTLLPVPLMSAAVAAAAAAAAAAMSVPETSPQCRNAFLLS